MMPGSALGSNVMLCEHSVLQEDQLAPNDTIWKGSPALPVEKSYHDSYLESLAGDACETNKARKRDLIAPKRGSKKYGLNQAEKPARRRRTSFVQKRQAEMQVLIEVEKKSDDFQRSYGKNMFQALLILTVLPALRLSIQIPAMVIFMLMLDAQGWTWAVDPQDLTSTGSGFEGVYMLPLGFFIWITTLFVLVPTYKKIIMPAGLSPGLYPLHSWKFIQIWAYTRVMAFADPIMDFLYGTMFIPLWVNLLGGDMPMSAECAAHLNTLNFIPELVEFKQDSFVASHVDLGTMVVSRGRLIVSKITIGERSMLGNHSWVSPGTVTGTGSLIGAYTVNQETIVPTDSTWFGSPAIELPRRFRHEASDVAYQPSLVMKLGRAISELFEGLIDAFLFTAVHFFYYGVTCYCIILYFDHAYWFLLLLAVSIGHWILCLSIHQIGHWTLVCGAGKPRYLPLWGWRLNLIMMFKRLEDILVRDLVSVLE
jgi:non-ribosomal peptide synthetase-like protein